MRLSDTGNEICIPREVPTTDETLVSCVLCSEFSEIRTKVQPYSFKIRFRIWRGVIARHYEGLRNQEGLNLNWIRHSLVYTDGVHLLNEITNDVGRNTDAQVGDLEVNRGPITCVMIFRYQNVKKKITLILRQVVYLYSVAVWPSVFPSLI